jgi:hypothetical protein
MDTIGGACGGLASGVGARDRTPASSRVGSAELALARVRRANLRWPPSVASAALDDVEGRHEASDRGAAALRSEPGDVCLAAAGGLAEQ